MARKSYEFSLILSGVDEFTDDALDRLYEAGCDDALFGVRDGVVFADFVREADSLTDAILSAARDIQRAKAGATVVHVEPDEFVTMSEVARRLGVTREGVRKWVLGTRGPGRFPPPTGSLRRRSPLWRWTDVVSWHRAAAPYLQGKPDAEPAQAEGKRTKGRARRTREDRPADIVESASDVAAVNAALGLLRYVGSERALQLIREFSAPRA